MPTGRENTITQMRELVAQNYNHPSIVVWGLSNEIGIGGSDEDLLENHRILNDMCHEMDKTRLTTIAAVSMCKMPHPIKGVSENPPLKERDCRGFLLTETAHAMLDSTNSFNLEYLLTAYQNFPNKETFFLKNGFFNKLAGGTGLKNAMVAGKSAEEIRASWQPALEQFKAIRAQYLLYQDFE